MQIVEHQHRRRADHVRGNGLGQGPEQALPRRDDRERHDGRPPGLARHAGERRLVGGHHRAPVADDPVRFGAPGFGAVVGDLTHEGPERLQRRALETRIGCRILQHRQAPARDDAAAACRRAPRHLEREPRLADAALPRHEDHATFALPKAAHRRLELAQNGLAADERRPAQVDARPGHFAAPGRRLGAGPGRPRREVARIRQPIARILGEQPQHELFELLGHTADQLAQGPWPGAAMLIDDLREVPDERCAAGQQFVDDAAQSVEVGARIEQLAVDLLGRHVLDRTGDAGLVEHFTAGRAPDNRHQSEVHQHREAVAGHEDVARLQIPMDDAFTVDVRQCFAETLNQAERLREVAVRGRQARTGSRGGTVFPLRCRLHRDRTEGRRGSRLREPTRRIGARLRGRRRPEPPGHRVERESLELLHRVPGQSGGGVVVEDAHDARVAEPCQRFDLSPDRGNPVGLRGADGLDSRPDASGPVDGGVHHTHAAPAEYTGDGIRADVLGTLSSSIAADGQRAHTRAVGPGRSRSIRHRLDTPAA